MAPTAPKVIKVVNLKRFMPETPEEPKKRTRYSPEVCSESLNTNDTLDNKSHNQELTETGHISQSPVEKKSDILNVSNSYQTRIKNRSKIKFRNCSHTIEELTKLHEHTDETLVKVGDIFETRDAFKEYLNDNARKWHYYYVCRNSKKNIIEYNCICMAYNLKQREVVLRKQKKRTTACPCKIRLTLDQTTHKLVAYYVCNHHDHPTTASVFYHYPHAKYLPQRVKEEFLDLTYLGMDTDLIQKYVHSVVGLTIKKKDIWSYAYKFRRKIFQRSIIDARQKYMEDLMLKIRETCGGSSDDTTKIDDASKHSKAVESINSKETKLITSSRVNVHKNSYIGTITEDLTGSEDSPLKEVFGDSTQDNTEVIVQYINEDGVLCDENCVPVTNSSAIKKFINNYTNLPPEKYLGQSMFGELVTDGILEVYPIDWESMHNESAMANSVILESEANVDSEGPVLIDRAADELAVMELENEAVIHDNQMRLPPIPPSSAVHADIGAFRKYFYVEHRYTPLVRNGEDQNAICLRKPNFNSPIDQSLEEYIQAPDFVTYPGAIRRCRGHAHLLALTAPDAVRPGAKFLTHDVFLAYINERARRWFFYYSLVESGRDPEYYVYKCVYGRGRVSRNAYRAKGLRKRNKLTTECPCQIRLRRVSWEPAYLTVLYSCNHHDHALDEGQFLAQPHSRRLTRHVREEVKDLITLQVNFEVLRKYVAAETGMRVYGKYFHNVRAGMRARGERRHFTEQKLAALKDKIRDLEAKYGNAANEKRDANVSQHQAMITVFHELCEVSDNDDFAEKVCIVQADTPPAEHTAKKSRLEMRLQNLSHQEFMMKVQKLQDAVRSDGQRNDQHIPNTYLSQ